MDYRWSISYLCKSGGANGGCWRLQNGVPPNQNSTANTTKHTGASTSVLAIYRATGDAMGGSRRGEIPLVVSLSLNCVVVVLFSKKIASRWLVCKVSQKYNSTLFSTIKTKKFQVPEMSHQRFTLHSNSLPANGTKQSI